MVHLRALGYGMRRLQRTSTVAAATQFLYGLNKESTKLPVGGAMQNVIELIHHDSPWLWFSLDGVHAPAQNDDGVYLHGC